MNQWPKSDTESLSGFYGKITVTDDGQPSRNWQHSFLDVANLPFPMVLAWDKKSVIRRIAVNRYCRKSLMNILSLIKKQFDERERICLGLNLFGGCYCYRQKRMEKELSVHSWAAAIDIDPNGNPFGKKGSMDERIVEIFENEGWQWGGRWKKPDPMHFEATNGR